MSGNGQPEQFLRDRLLMVEQQLRNRDIRDEKLLAAMTRVPRHRFVPPEYIEHAYGDYPIPIGEGQTISQPYIVAAMLEAVQLQPEHLVLEIGTGSGYQAGVIAELVRHVFTIERRTALAEHAGRVLDDLGYGNVTVLIGDGSQGLQPLAPFDAIVISAAAPRIPPALFEQLREGGTMVLPVGGANSQELQLVRKQEGSALMTRHEPCRFVPLVGSEGFSSGF